MPAASWLGAPAARRIITHGLMVAAALSLPTGCGLLDTNQPDIIEPGGLETPEGAEALRVGAIHDFAFVKDGDGSQVDTEGLVLLTGDMGDEFMHSGFIPSTVEFDQRLAGAQQLPAWTTCSSGFIGPAPSAREPPRRWRHLPWTRTTTRGFPRC